MKRILLTEEELSAELDTLEGWSIEGRELVKSFKFGTYLAGIDFVNHVARMAEEMDHHPDMLIGWRKVTLRVTTHSSGGLTELDVTLAREVERLAV